MVLEITDKGARWIVLQRAAGRKDARMNLNLDQHKQIDPLVIRITMLMKDLIDLFVLV